MESAGRLLLIAGAVLAVLGGALLLAARLGIDRFPGDIVIRRDGLTIYIPLGLMIAVSVLGSIALYLLRRL
jgi:Protein of unknown function (DUF2905)